jgi:filamentous hemagglutinin family protein
MLRSFTGDPFFSCSVLSLTRDRRGVSIALAACSIAAMSLPAQAGTSLRAGGMSGLAPNGSSSAAATSQVVTPATGNTAQSIAANSVSQQAQASLLHSIHALQTMQAAQASARAAAINGANNLGLNPNTSQPLPTITDGLGGTGLVPTGGVTPTLPNSTVQVVQLGGNNNGALNLNKGGSVSLPEGTPGNDTVSITGAGTVTNAGGTVTATAGSITTQAGGTISTTSGGSIAIAGSASTLTTVTATSLTSSVAGIITPPGGGAQFTLPANTAEPIPAGSKITFSGTTAGTVSINGAGTVALGGAGTLTLAGTPSASSGGTITSNAGAVTFTSGVTTTLAVGASVNLNGAGSINFAGGTGGNVPVLIPSTTSDYTTSGSLLSTTGYTLPASWVNISGLSQSVNPNTQHITDIVTQDAQQALLYWNSFNLGKNTTLDFDQSKGGANVSQWVAINEITDPTLAPSQILGAINAPGQVYVINQNGIIFGGSSQVNAGALTASSLALNPEYINNGLLNVAGNNFDFQFSSLFTTVTAQVGTGAQATLQTTVEPLWTAPPAVPFHGSESISSVSAGDVTVQAGAQLTSPTNVNHQGGRIALIAPNVTNDGTISTPDGQTILAAGLQVGFAAHNADDASLRGLDVYVGQVSAGASTLPTHGTFTFDGIQPNNPAVTFAGTGQVGTYIAPGATTSTPIMANVATTIPLGSTVVITGGGMASFAAFAGGKATNAANTLDGQGNILTPSGDIEAPRADITLTGAEVDQLGIINGSTSVTLNGRIDLLADYNSVGVISGQASAFSPSASGVVTMGGQSVTQILPESSSTETTIGTQLAFSSLIDVQGLSINMLPGSLLYAPGASQPAASTNAALNLVGQKLTSGVTLDAGSWTSDGTPPDYQATFFTNSNGQIALDQGATIDVAGLQNVEASVAEDIIPVQLRGPQLANSVTQRNGALRGTTVYVDIRDFGIYNGTPWIGTPIGDVSGYVNDIGRTVGELSTNGGSVALDAGTSVAVNQGATINVSGGWINYAGANVQTTEVMSHGQVLNISQATPNLVFSGLDGGFTATSSKWGVSQTFINSLTTGSQYDAGFVQGGGAGSISIAAPAATVSGNFYGNTMAGSGQRTPIASLASTYAGATFLPTIEGLAGNPQSGSFSLSFLQLTSGRAANVYQANSPSIQFETDAFIAQNAPTANQVYLSQDLVNQDGFGNLTLDTSPAGTILVPQGISLVAPAGGALTWRAANIDIEGSVSSPGGAFSFNAVNIAQNSAPGQFGNFTMGSDGTLSTAGLVVDDRPLSAAADTLPLAINGGSVLIKGLAVDLAPGSSVDVSGGVSVNASSTATYGTAGSISISGLQLVLGSTLTGYSGKVGGAGSLTVLAPLVQIGGASLLNGDNSTGAVYQGETGVQGNGETLWLDPADSKGDFFAQGGFGNFNIEGQGQIATNSSGAFEFDAAGNPIILPGMLIAADAQISPVVQGSFVSFNGGGLSLSPMSTSQLLPYQRTPVNLTLESTGLTSTVAIGGPPLPGGGTFTNQSGGGGLLIRGDLVMQTGASIQTDPQTNSTHGVSLLAPNGTIAILGKVVAPGGTITVRGGSTASASSNKLLFYNSSPDQPFPTVDLGHGSLLSTAGGFEQTVNNQGYLTGSVLPGGNVAITGNIVAESGATINVSGASALLSESQASLGLQGNRLSSLALVPTRIDSNAGSIAFNASQLFYDDATLLGSAGGPSAQGGGLSLTAGFSATPGPQSLPPTLLDVSVIISQQGLNGGFSLPAGIGSGTALLGVAIPGSDTAIGGTVNTGPAAEGVYAYFVANPNLFVSTTADKTLSNNGGQAGGFGSLSIAGTLDFVGPVNITTDRSLTLARSSGSVSTGETGGVIYADAAVVLTAPYVALNSFASSQLPDQLTGYPAATSGPGSLTINAGTLADVGNLSLQNIGTLTFNSNPAQAGDVRGVGTLAAGGQINLNAAQVYPPTDSTFTISATDVSITAPQGQALPSLPLSAGGTLNIDATTIEQDGVLRAPFGVINLGTGATQSVTLSAGGITSVSGVDPTTGQGITVPYGIVDASGNWFDPQGNNITLTGPPAKAINISGQNIDLESGSTVDVAGGGNLYAYQFNPGTGGNQDILASLGTNVSSTSFAIIPGYTLNYAPEATYAVNNNLETNNVADAGYFNSSLAVGEQIYLNASNGLSAGLYTLLPARYATLPDAFLITPGSGAAPGLSVSQPGGTSSLVSGYVSSGLNPTTLPVFSSYQVYSQAEVLNMAPYVSNLANTFFPASAAANNLSTPRLPIDAGQLVLNATGSMSVQGTLLSQAAPGGLGGEVDIASAEPIYIVGPNTTNVPAGALELDSSQLTSFGAASLLIGGFRTTTTAGTAVTVTTDDLVVDNSGATTTVGGVTVDGLAAPDLTLVSNVTLTVADGAAIEQIGQLSGKAPTLTLQGNGSLLRVSSDSTAQIVRQNVTPDDTTSVLSIGQGVKILNANGAAAGALTLDSTGLVSINPSTTSAPVLMGKAVTLDSSLINLELGAPATSPTSGLVITAPQLTSLLSSTQSLSLLSYSSIAIFGSGQIGGVTIGAGGQKTYQETSLALHADDIYYADTQNSAGVTINAQTVTLDNLANGTTLPTLAGLGTSGLAINAQTITLGSNAMRMDQFTSVALNADSAILLKGLGSTLAGSDAAPVAASLSVGGNLTLTTPLITSATSADQPISATTTTLIDVAINASGSLVLQAPTTAAAALTSDSLAASLFLSGSSITQNSGSIVLHSGSIALQANGASGSPGGADITINGTLEVSGVAPAFYNLTKYTNGGQVMLDSLNGNVTVGGTGLVNVSAASGSGTADSGVGNGGTLSVIAAGLFTPGKLKGQGGTVSQGTVTIAQGMGGTFALDAGSLDSSGAGTASLSSLESGLTGFATQSIRDRNDSTVTVDGTVKAGNFDLSSDKGSLIVSGTIDASNVTAIDPNGNPILVGGTIGLQAGGSVTVTSTGVLNASGQSLNNAGQCGTVNLAAGAYEGAPGASTTASINVSGTVNLGVNGGVGGTLNLRAPQVSGGAYVASASYTPVAVNASGGGAPTDVAVAPIAGGVIENASKVVVEGFYVQDAQQASALIDTYEGNAESNASAFMAQATTIQGRIFGAATANTHIQPGEEIDNSVGSLELQNTWDLSTLRYGASLEPGILTVRAAGDINIDFLASLTDGFDTTGGFSYLNPLLPIGSQSWSYNITSGADFSAAQTSAVKSAAQLQNSGLGGSLQVGVQDPAAPVVFSTFSVNTPDQFYQTIRTGTGNIAVNSGGDVLLLNNLATIYTAGTQVDPTLGGSFTPPAGTDEGHNPLPATYSNNGGNVSITAQGMIAHETYNSDGSGIIADSSAELPTNWLDREGQVTNGQVINPTTWWVDFTNFFEGVGALGGGNVSLTAGGSIVNVDAAVPTNARLVNGQLTELGGGNLTVSAGNNIDAGVYYIERGQGTLAAGQDILTNATRAAVGVGQSFTQLDWLPTSLYLGVGSFSVTAQGSLLLGPTVNPFLLPQSYNNIASRIHPLTEISYFSTYGANDAVNAEALNGSLTIQDSPDSGQGSLYAWYTNVMDSDPTSPQPGNELCDTEPWLDLAEAVDPQSIIAGFGPSSVTLPGSPLNSYGGAAALLPPTLRATSFTGDINLIGSLTLSPAPLGTVNLVASGAINAFTLNQQFSVGGLISFYGSGLVNLSDTDPANLPGITDPLNSSDAVANLSQYFNVTGATTGLTLQEKQFFHANINGEPLHANDPNPIYIYAGTGDISGLNVFAPKQAQVIAGRDITDVGLYLQNINASDITLVEAGRDIIAYDASSVLRQAAGSDLMGFDPQNDPVGNGAGAPNSGDIQIAGPGTLEVLAGRNLTLGNDNGVTPNNLTADDGVNAGLVSIGGSSNPALPFAGSANLFAAAGISGIGPATGLQQSSLNTFINDFLNPTSANSATYLPDLAAVLNLGSLTNDQVWAAFQALPAANQDVLALDMFYLVLRDAGRDHNNPGSPGFGNFNAANQAISTLFPTATTGNIDVTSREIKTTNGGDINLLTPGGQVTVGIDLPSASAVNQGILTADGGNVSIFADGNVNVGTSRIFTLHGGNEVIWSTHGNIAAGASSKTVLSAPPTRVIVDPTSGAVGLDLAGLATGGGIGVLASIVGTPPGDVDLIAPAGIVDAGDAGIRASGNLNIAALKVVNAANISVGGKSSGVPGGASVNVGAATAAASAAGSSEAAAQNGGPNNQQNAANNGMQDLPSIITVDVLGYGGDDE